MIDFTFEKEKKNQKHFKLFKINILVGCGNMCFYIAHFKNNAGIITLK